MIQFIKEIIKDTLLLIAITLIAFGLAYAILELTGYLINDDYILTLFALGMVIIVVYTYSNSRYLKDKLCDERSNTDLLSDKLRHKIDELRELENKQLPFNIGDEVTPINKFSFNKIYAIKEDNEIVYQLKPKGKWYKAHELRLITPTDYAA